MDEDEFYFPATDEIGNPPKDEDIELPPLTEVGTVEETPEEYQKRVDSVGLLENLIECLGKRAKVIEKE